MLVLSAEKLIVGRRPISNTADKRTLITLFFIRCSSILLNAKIWINSVLMLVKDVSSAQVADRACKPVVPELSPRHDWRLFLFYLYQND